ncbi:AAA family ATPase [Streptomyces sp. NPDC020996]|uniref:helix-turn-helix transcriptional regulator n=1 Tax=Streptomyces sp. NPDC020996 TaxID=3154791 RepID=UPI0033D7C35F
MCHGERETERPNTMLLCRETACTQLDRALEACIGGTSGVVLLEGAAGCGKTELLLQFAETATGYGATVLRAAAPGDADAGAPHATVHRLLAELTGTDGPPPTATPTAHEFTAALRRAAAHAPVVVCVDDLHRIDGASLAYLLHAAHAVRGAAVLLVLACAPLPHADSPLARTELLRHPHFLRIGVERLDEQGSAALLARYTAQPAEPATAALLHRISGGNPLLLRALLTELPLPADGRGPTSDGPFADAVLTCLERAGDDVRRLATALAVLGAADDNAPRPAADLAGTTPSAALRAALALEDAGLTENGRLRHPAVAAAVLDRVPAPERAALHGRAARTLHEHGAPADTVARHLLTAGAPAAAAALRGADAVKALREAALQALIADGDLDHAAACLELAVRLSPDAQAGWEMSLRLAAVTWPSSPGAAEHQLDEPLAALRRGDLAPGHAGRLARLLVAQGRIEDAAQALERTAPRTARADPLRELFALPPQTAPAPAPAEQGERHPQAGSAELRNSAALWTHPGSDNDDRAAEQLLKGTPLAHANFDPIVQAVRTLVHTDRPDRAVVWCTRIQAQLADGRTPGWQAVFGLLHAEALLRTGDLAGSEREARAALDAVAGRGGVFLFGPLAALVAAQTAAGRIDAAARLLQMPVPEELFASVYALTYLRARGQYYLATHRSRAALDEFLDAGRLAQRWGLDRPRQLPWRTDAAEALLQLGEHRQAERFVVEQLATPDARSPRVRGLSLRLRAATAEPHQRPKLLTRAVDELRRCGDRLELVRALADLGRALQLLGEGNRAAMISRRARYLATECGALRLAEQIMPGPATQDHGTPPAEPGAATTPDAEQLSESERRVAALAAYGYTNREISAKLFITVSTVEQHLTRVYRKLNISRRQDLPMDLQLENLESLSSA